MILRLLPKTILFLLFTSIVSASFAQERKKPWGQNHPLDWSDYQGEIPSRTKLAAETYCGTDYGYRQHITGGRYNFSFEVSCYMDRNKSWVRPGSRSAYLLRHEQLHFDIAEFFARQLLSALTEHSYTSNYSSEMEQVERQVTNSREMMEQIYDDETVHSINRMMQARWEAYVDDLLQHNYTLLQALAKMPR